MKSVIRKTRLVATLLPVIIICASCRQANPVPTYTPTFIPLYTSYTPTLVPSSTFTPSPTFTETPTLTPTPILVSVIKDTFLFSGPSKNGYEKITRLPIGTKVEALGEFVDFVLVRLYGTSTPQQGYVPVIMLGDVPPYLPIITVEQTPWKSFMSMASPDKPIVEQNDSKDWVGSILAHGIYFTNGLQIKLNLESVKGSNGIVFQGTGIGVPWWRGQKRIEFFYEAGALQILLRDGTQENQVYDSKIPLQITNGITTGEVNITFDQFGKNMQISQDNTVIFKLTFGNVGDFPNGLFPLGQILSLTLSTGPDASGKLTELIFSVPPDGKYK